MEKKYRSPREIRLGWHSIEPWSEVYHNNPYCTEGNNIEVENEKEGTANRRLFRHCEDLNRRKK